MSRKRTKEQRAALLAPESGWLPAEARCHNLSRVQRQQDKPCMCFLVWD